jgi:hypothetical protein
MTTPVESDSNSSVSLSNQCKTSLSLLESVRDLLARRLVHECIAIREDELNNAVLTTILQVLFLRTGQEYGLVEPGTLVLLAGSDGISRRMARACSDAGLTPHIFETGPDSSRTIPAVPDDTLREVIRCMDTVKFPLPVSTMPLEHLVIVFEHFLGTRMCITDGFRITRAAKSAVRYTGSVRITAQAVVDYVVKEVFGDLTVEPESCQGKGVRILDPACGSGIFLLAAYRFLSRRQARCIDRPEKRKELLRELACQSIHGTDIDSESVTVARFILVLSFIEECRLSGSEEVIPDSLRKICMCMKKTIRSGNALISRDYFAGRQEDPFNAEERQRVNPFSWHHEFPHILDSGGFDAIIGAPPPYQPFTIKARDEYFQTHYDVYAKGAGIYSYFIEKGFQILHPDGTLAFVIPETFLRINGARPLRKLLLTKQIEEIVKFCEPKDLKTENMRSCFIHVSNKKPTREFFVSIVANVDVPDLARYIDARKHPIDQNTLTESGWMLGDKRRDNLLKKMQSVGTPLEEYVMGAVYPGLETGISKAFVIHDQVRRELIEKEPKSEELIRPFVPGRDIRRYQPPESGTYIILMQKGWTNSQSGNEKNKWNWLKENYPKITRHLELNAGSAEKKTDKGDYWWELLECDNLSDFEKPKIICSFVQGKPAFTFDSHGIFFSNSDAFMIPKGNFLLLGILSSKLGLFFLSGYCVQEQDGCHLLRNLGKTPIYTIDFDNPDDKTRHDRMVTLVTEMLELHKHMSQAKTDREKRLITQEIESTDRQIDSLVYGLYGLTADEIAVVEDTLPR